MTIAPESAAQAVGENRGRITGFQRVFGAAAPILSLGLDRIFEGLVTSSAPAALWSLAIIGPAVLIASARPLASRSMRAIVAGLAFACALCAWAALVAGFAFVLITNPLARALLFEAGGLLWMIILPPAYALFACGQVYWARARILLAGGEARSPWMFAAGIGLVAALLALETVDRAYFSYRLRQLGSGDVKLIEQGARGLAYYPLTLTVRKDDACFAFIGQPLGPDEDYDFRPALRRGFTRRYGDQEIEAAAAAAPLFGPDPIETCVLEYS